MGELDTVLDRVQSDYDFYVAMLSDPAAALAPYALTAAEAEIIRDPNELWRYLAAAEARKLTGVQGQVFGPDEGPPNEGPPNEGPPVGPGIVLPIEGPPNEGPPLEGPPPIGGVGVRGPGGLVAG